jgi:hypothetical protein
VADHALTVGAVDGDDRLAPFSATGPRPGDLGIKPDIVAPGVGIVAAKAQHGVIGQPTDNPRYVALDGTSMAAPHVTGAAAVLAGEHPDWSGDQLKAALMASAKPLPGIDVFARGAGRLDLGRAIGQHLTATPASISTPTQRWPHTDDQPVATTVSYENTGKTPLTIALSMAVTGPDHKPAASGMFTISPASLTVPAGGTASATVTTNTKLGSVDGQYTGEVSAKTTDNQSIITPYAVNREVESYNLTLRSLGTDGAAATDVAWDVGGYDSKELRLVENPQLDGTATVRLPKGHYGVASSSYDLSTAVSIDMAAPWTDLDRDTTLVFDGRKAKPGTVTVDEPGAAVTTSQSYQAFKALDGTRIAELATGRSDPTQLRTGSVGPAAPGTAYESVLSSDWAAPGPNGDFVNSPYAFHLTRYTSGQLPTGYVEHARKSALARIRQPVGGVGDAGQTTRGALFATPDGYISPVNRGYNPTNTSTTPDTMTLYVSPSPVGWSFDVDTADASGRGVASQSSNVRFFAAKDYTDPVNTPVFGPGFFAAGPGSPGRSVQAPGALFVQPLMFSTGNPAYAGIARGKSTSVLYKNGTKVADGTDSVTDAAPSADASYRLTSTFSQTLAATSTTVSGDWTFRSKQSTNPAGDPLPLFALRFGAVPDAGKTVILPVTVSAQLPKSKVNPPTIDFSTDDGKTWQHAVVTATGTNAWNAAIANPASGFVSLRASATDAAGTTCTQVITRAYAVS